MDVFTQESKIDMVSAAESALAKLVTMTAEYEMVDDIFVDSRNLEALWSLKEEMRNIINGR